MKMCPRCCSAVRRIRRRWYELRLLPFRPYRCECCQRRFYVRRPLEERELLLGK